MTAGGGIVDIAADVDIIGRIEFRDGGIVNGMDNAVVDWHDVVVDVGEVGTGGGVDWFSQALSHSYGSIQATYVYLLVLPDSGFKIHNHCYIVAWHLACTTKNIRSFVLITVETVINRFLIVLSLHRFNYLTVNIELY